MTAYASQQYDQLETTKADGSRDHSVDNVQRNVQTIDLQRLGYVREGYIKLFYIHVDILDTLTDATTSLSNPRREREQEFAARTGKPGVHCGNLARALGNKVGRIQGSHHHS